MFKRRSNCCTNSPPPPACRIRQTHERTGKQLHQASAAPHTLPAPSRSARSMPKNGRVAEPGLVGVAPGIGVTRWPPLQDHGTARHATARHTTVRHTTARHTTACHATPRRAASEHAIPQQVTPQRATSEQATLPHTTRHIRSCAAQSQRSTSLVCVTRERCGQDY